MRLVIWDAITLIMTPLQLLCDCFGVSKSVLTIIEDRSQQSAQVDNVTTIKSTTKRVDIMMLYYASMFLIYVRRSRWRAPKMIRRHRTLFVHYWQLFMWITLRLHKCPISAMKDTVWCNVVAINVMWQRTLEVFWIKHHQGTFSFAIIQSAIMGFRRETM